MDSDPEGMNQLHSDSNSVKIEFSNLKSTELFGMNLSEDKTKRMVVLDRLVLPKFVRLEKRKEAELYEPESVNEEGMLKAARALLDSENHSQNA